jgi:hypothetical protein
MTKRNQIESYEKMKKDEIENRTKTFELTHMLPQLPTKHFR